MQREGYARRKQGDHLLRSARYASGMNQHRSLKVWKLAGRLIDIAYDLTKHLPPEERFVANTQLRRAAWSVQNNIAEGHARRGAAELRRFLDVSLASLAEVDSMLGKLSELYHINTDILDEAESLRRAITKLLFAMIRRRRGDNN